MNAILRRKLSLVAACVGTTFITALGAVPAHAALLIAPLPNPTPITSTIEAPPSKPGPLLGVQDDVYFGNRISWSPSSGGKGVGPIEYRWQVTASSCLGDYTVGTSGITASNSAVITTKWRSVCSLTIGVEALLLKSKGGFMSSGSTYYQITTVVTFPSETYESRDSVLIDSIIPNYGGSGYAQINLHVIAPAPTESGRSDCRNRCHPSHPATARVWRVALQRGT